ncbi:Ribosomal RNA small subunit methyltransferase D [bacterium HR40]|nr:Ribosomal RNA small subunit methyltransferase D [bacterium HR40]
MSVRILTGRLKGRRIYVPRGQDIRPTSERTREALFDILAHGTPRLVGCRFLDLFAGTGAVGIEAWSRGAAEVVLVELERTARAVIERNLRTLDLPDTVRLLVADATNLGACPRPFDIVFLDPPWRSGQARPALERALAGGWIAPEARVIVELAAKEPFAPPLGLEIVDERRYGLARLVFLRPTLRPQTGPVP